MKKETLQIRVEPDLTEMINQAVQRTGLTRSEVLRESLRKGIPAMVQGAERRPKKSIVDTLLKLKGLDIPHRRHPMSSRL